MASRSQGLAALLDIEIMIGTHCFPWHAVSTEWCRLTEVKTSPLYFLDEIDVLKAAMLPHGHHLGVGCARAPPGLDVLLGSGGQREAHDEGAMADVQPLLSHCEET